MGYTTDFEGSVTVEPPLNEAEIAFLKKFNDTRRMNRKKGPYYVDGGGFAGQDQEEDIIDFNSPPRGQPGLWCQWVPTEDGTQLEWDGGEKFYESVKWMQYIIDHFLKPGAIAAAELPFLQANHVVTGEIFAQGEESSDKWKLVVENNKARSVAGTTIYRE